MNSTYSTRQTNDSNRLYYEIQKFPEDRRGSVLELAITFIRGMQAQERLGQRTVSEGR